MPSIIGADLKIAGDLTCEGEVQIEGSVEGDVACRSIIVGADATVVGTIECDSARVSGRINGKITAQSVELTSSAHVVGDILHERITIETGAYFEGSLKHVGASSSPTDPVKASADGAARVKKIGNKLSPGSAESTAD